MNEAKTFLSIGECMIEMALMANGDYRLGFAGDTLNTAWYARALLPAQSWKVAYFTRLGPDVYSARLRDFLETNRITTDLVTMDPARQPGLYLIDIENGERSFTYWRDQSAARLLADDEYALERAMDSADIIYFSGITLAILTPEKRRVFLALVAKQRDKGKTTVFDPNARPKLWESLDFLRQKTMKAAAAAAIVLPSFDDEKTIFGDADIDATATRYLKAGAGLTVVKNGGGDMLVSDGTSQNRIDGHQRVEPVDTTGAGDSFNGAFLAAIAQGAAVKEAVERAHAIATRVVMHRGALMPMDDILA
ncbi:MAG: 2-dehydro-3-deoxygluconokinase [Rhizobiales bacterium]|nr:2-dehydro-3-deoxygluconokinase [Hyphomicrobiales bacterium]MBA67393.1 2-dehydro-3-deoxygluconokinase [Hyphomicrobiales bacterium]|tara:strand:- start:323 stop:1243 length:921 start_codon:yes stop_codon:yes gene_type:complete